MTKRKESAAGGNHESDDSIEGVRYSPPADGNQRTEGNKKTKVSSNPVPKATGPRTLSGKQRGKRNATRHGIFSSVAVLENERRQDYDSLVAGLRHSLQPIGKIEEILVEKLATLSWRHRRLLIAEGAEIRRSQEFFEWDRKQQQELEAEEQAEKVTESSSRFLTIALDERGYTVGLIWKTGNVEILERCLELLEELRESFSNDGFASGDAESILRRIYGAQEAEHLRETLQDDFFTWSRTVEVPEDERKEGGYASPQECKENFLDSIDAEIARLKKSWKEQQVLEARRIEVEKLRYSIPDKLALERLQRYEVTLERAFDRALIQLERLQRMRLGQPLPPPLKVEVS